MARVSPRVVVLAAWFVLAILALGAPVAAAGDVPADGSRQITADHASHAQLAVGHGRPARHRAIRQGRSGARQLPSSSSAMAVTVDSNNGASSLKARRVHVPARHLLLNLVVPRAPATILV